MIIYYIVLVKIFIYKILLRPWDIGFKVSPDNKLMFRNLVTVSSIIYNIANTYLKLKIPEDTKNQDHVPRERRIKPTKKVLLVNDHPDFVKSFVMPSQSEQHELMLLGLYDKT